MRSKWLRGFLMAGIAACMLLTVALAGTFSVTLPTALPVSVDAEGNVTTAEPAIKNTGGMTVTVAAATVEPLDGWTIVPWGTDFGKLPVSSKKFAMQFYGSEVPADGVIKLPSQSTIPVGGSAAVVYDARIAVQSSAAEDLTIANCCIVVDSDEPEVPTGAVMAANSSWYKSSTPKASITEIELVDRYTPTGEETESWDASAAGDGSVMAYLNGTKLTLAGNGTGKIYANPDARGYFTGFDRVTSIQGLEKLCTSAVIDMSDMFSYCDSLASLDLTGWNTSNVTNMTAMFSSCYSLINLDLSSWDTSNVTDMSGMFDGCERLVSLDLSSWNTSKVTNMSDTFLGCQCLVSLDLSSWNTSKVTDMTYMFSECKSLTNIDGIAGWNTSSVTNMSWLFRECKSLTSLDLTGWNTSNVTNMTAMFSSCYSLINLDLSSWDTSNVTDMSGMFDGCERLVSLDLSSWNTSKVTNMSGTFWGCSSLETIYASESWSTASVTESDNMFYGCGSLCGAIPFDRTKTTADYANYNTGYLTNINGFQMSYEYWRPQYADDWSISIIRPDKTYSGTPGDGSFIVGNSPQDQKTLSAWFAANRPDRMSFTGMVNEDGTCTIEIKCYKGTTEITPYFSGMDSISAVLNEDGTVSCHWGNMTPLPDEFKTAILGTCCNDGSVAYTEIRFYYDGQGSAQSVMAAAAPEGAEQIIAPAGEEPGNGSSADAVTEIEPTTEETQEDTQEDTASADGKDEQTAEPPDEGGSTAGIILTLALPAAWKGVLYGKTK